MAGRVSNLVLVLPFLEGPVSGVVHVNFAHAGMGVEICLPDLDHIFPGPASFRKDARNLTFPRQFLKIQENSRKSGKFKQES